MGTNYFAVRLAAPACECCGRSDPPDEFHIGKSSRGWAFSLHVIPEKGLISLDAWKAFWSQHGVIIRDEYGDRHTPEDMETRITSRTFTRRHKVDGQCCTGHGLGSWDYITGEFS